MPAHHRLTTLARDGARGLAPHEVAEALDLVGAALTPVGPADATPSREARAAGVRDLVRRLLSERDVALALLELRLEAARRPEIAAVVAPWVAGAVTADGAAARAADPDEPGVEVGVAALHALVDGLVLDALAHHDAGPDGPAGPTCTAAVLDHGLARLG